jgi:hypothetical protein
MKEHAGWFQPGSISLSFVVAGIAAAIIVSGVFFLVRHLTRRNLAQGAGHH